jgi:LmbE family N-acetylglucosaminyl deacetylase
VLEHAHAWTPPPVPTVVVVPHPGDEVLIAGGLIPVQRRRRMPVRVLAVTDGENANGSDRSRRLVRQRCREQLAALEALGVARDDIERLRIGDGSVADRVAQVAEWIATEYPGHLVVAPWVVDDDPDHAACGLAAESAVGPDGQLVFGFCWTWDRRDPASLDAGRLRRLDLRKRVMRQRAQAIMHHRTRADRRCATPTPTPDDGTLDPLRWNAEYYIDGTRSRGR